MSRAAILLGSLIGIVLLSGCSDRSASSPASTATSQPAPSASDVQPTAPDPEPTLLAAAPVVVGDVATSLDAPWSVAVLGDDSALVSQRDSADVVLLTRSQTGWDRTLAGHVTGVQPAGEGGLLGLAMPPQGGQVYAMYTSSKDNRVVRMPWDGATLGQQEVVLSGMPKAEIHNGGRLAFGPDGMLYISTGDAGNGASAQDRASLAGKILRVTPDGGVPADNPDPGSPVYSYGHRNVQGLAFDTAGRLWATEFGAKDVDEVNLIVAGGNYGWPTTEGAAGIAGLIDPVVQWSPTAVASPSGAAILGESLWVASLRGGTLYQVQITAQGQAGAPIAHLTGQYGRLRDVVVGPSGALWLVTNNSDGRGTPRPGDDRIIELRVDGR